jgi:hypothetical protein
MDLLRGRVPLYVFSLKLCLWFIIKINMMNSVALKASMFINQEMPLLELRNVGPLEYLHRLHPIIIHAQTIEKVNYKVGSMVFSKEEGRVLDFGWVHNEKAIEHNGRFMSQYKALFFTREAAILLIWLALKALLKEFSSFL